MIDTIDTDTSKLVLTTAVAAGTTLWGWFGWLIIVWVACMGLDVISGMAANAKKGNWSSAIAREGLWHKFGMILAVTVAAITDILIGLLLNMDGLSLPFHYKVLVCPVVVAWYSLTELGSIAENAEQLGAPMPSWLIKLLKTTANTVNHVGDKVVGDDTHE